jgi:phage baseplate assembly protein W
MARGMNGATGKPLEGLAHLRQSITDILMTRKGTRVMRRDYGSDIPNIIDRPANDQLPVDLYIACAEAFHGWEPRLELKEAAFKRLGDGVIEFSFIAVHKPDGKVIELSEIVVK